MKRALISLLTLFLVLITEVISCTHKPPTPPPKIIIIFVPPNCIYIGICVEFFRPPPLTVTCGCGTKASSTLNNAIDNAYLGYSSENVTNISDVIWFDPFNNFTTDPDVIDDILRNETGCSKDQSSSSWKGFSQVVDGAAVGQWYDENEQRILGLKLFLWFKIWLFRLPKRGVTMTVSEFATGAIGDTDHPLDCAVPAQDPTVFIPINGGAGDPHYISLDGKYFKYDGPCSYILLTNQNCNNNNNGNNLLENDNNKFTIITHHGQCGSLEKRITCIKALEAHLRIGDDNDEEIKILISSNNKVYLNDNQIEKFPYINNGLEIQEMVSNYMENATTTQLIYYVYDRRMDLLFSFSNEGAGIANVLIIPEESRGKTCGLLGNGNGNILDDFNNYDINDVVGFGDSWFIQTDYQPLRCQLYPTNSFLSYSECSFNSEEVEKICYNMIKNYYFKKLNGRNVEKCFNEENNPRKRDWRNIDAIRIFDDCVTQICDCNEMNYEKCEPSVALDKFKTVCEENNVNFPTISWKDFVMNGNFSSIKE